VGGVAEGNSALVAIQTGALQLAGNGVGVQVPGFALLAEKVLMGKTRCTRNGASSFGRR